MAYSDNLTGSCENLFSQTRNLNDYISSEAYGGKWQDEVGASYVTYTERLTHIAGRLKDFANDIRAAEESINAIDETADKSRLESLKSKVSAL